MISISSELFDITAPFLLQEDADSDLSYVSRRVSRSATLDGGCIIVDNGYSVSDATFTINITNVTLTQKNQILELVKLHSGIIVATKSGVFLGVVEKVDDVGKLAMRFLVKSNLSEE